MGSTAIRRFEEKTRRANFPSKGPQLVPPKPPTRPGDDDKPSGAQPRHSPITPLRALLAGGGSVSQFRTGKSDLSSRQTNLSRRTP